MTLRRRPRVRPGLRAGVLAAAAVGSAVWAGGCTVPITGKTITGGALNAGAMLFVDQLNADSYEGRGYYDYVAEAGTDTLAAIFETAIEEANRAFVFPTPGDRDVASGARDAASGDRPEASGNRPEATRFPGATRFPDRQWTPAPLFSVRPGSPVTRGDTLLWVVTHRARRQVAFLLISHGDSATTVALVPYSPPDGAFLSVPTDHAQRNAVEALHQAFYLAAVERLGREVFVEPRQAVLP